MVREIVKDPAFLAMKSSSFFPERDKHIIEELIATADAHKDNCAGLAAPQIGYHIRAIVVNMNGKFVPYINPVIVKRSPGWYYTQEGCLSLDGQRSVKRNHIVMVSYTTMNGKRHTRQFSGRIAQIIQHEVDHLNGVLI